MGSSLDVFLLPGYSTAANATGSVQENTYTIGTTSTGANVANVKFTSSAANASGLLLTAYDTGHVVTGYVSNSTAYVQTVATPADGTHYKAIAVTVSAELTTGDGSLADALSSLNAQGYVVKAKVKAAGYARAAFVTTASTLFSDTYTANTVSVGADNNNDYIVASSNVTAITSFASSQTYTVYVSVAPKNQNGTADVAGDHSGDNVEVTVSVEIPA